MKLLYFKEHLSCINYQINVNTGFVYYNLEKDSVSKIDNSASPCILFLLDGEVSIDSGEYQNVHIEKDKMVIIPQHVDNKIEVIYDAKCLLLFWNKDIRVCDKVYMNSLSSYKERKKEMCVLPIRDPLQAVLNSVVAYLYAKMQCKHMHLIKQQEVLLVLRGYYTKKELFTFFSSILGNTGHFEDFVMNNYRKVKSVKEFAGLYCTSERSFNRKFQNCFKESPYQWMQKKKAELIREKISESDTPFQEIAMDFDFNSQAHFTSYCKRLFGMTPSKLRTESKKVAPDLEY